jgi:hypothetical protein
MPETQTALLEPPVAIPTDRVTFSRKSALTGAHYEFTVVDAADGKVEVVAVTRNGQPIKQMTGIVKPSLLKVTKAALGFDG